MKILKSIGGLSLVLALSLFISCVPEEGCTDSRADNYSASAEEDDGSCECESQVTFTNEVNEDYTIESSSGSTWIIDNFGSQIITQSGVGSCFTYRVYNNYGNSSQEFVGSHEQCACEEDGELRIFIP